MQQRVVQAGDLVAFDADTTGWSGYSVDFSRTWVCGADQGTPVQRSLHARALEQLQHGAAMGLYPNRRVIDAAFSVVHNGRQKNLYVWAELRSNAVKRRSVPSPSKW